MNAADGAARTVVGATEAKGAALPAAPSVLDLFAAFLRLGLTSFGGPAMVAHIRSLAVRQRGWLDDAEFQQGIALCQSLPGATAMQTAAYVGLSTRGLAGAGAAYVGFGLPAFLLMLLLSALYRAGHALAPVYHVFGALQLLVVALVAHAAWSRI